MPRDTAARLNTWKEIASFLGRDERTAKRWEATRQLPIRRVPGGRSTVFAYVGELNTWLAQGSAGADAASEPIVNESVEVEPGREFSTRSTQRSQRWRIAGTAALGVIVAAAALRIVFPSAHMVAAAAPPPLYLQGLFAWNTRTRSGLSEAIADFSQVILDHPGYAPAYAGLADCYNLMPEYGGMSAAQAYPQAKVAATRAVALDDRLPAAYRALGFVDFWWSHDVVASRREFVRALALDPNAAQTHHWYGNTLAMTGVIGPALAELDAAMRLDPAAIAIRADHANAMFIAGQRREAIDQLEAIASAQPDFTPAHRYLAGSYMAIGDSSRATAALTAVARASGDAGDAAIAAAARAGLARGGAAGMATAIRVARRVRYAAGEMSPYAMAQSEAAIDSSRALALLETSLVRGESAVMGIAFDPALLPLHGKTRFRDLETRLHLPARS